MPRPYRVALLQLRAYNLAAHEQAWAEMLLRVEQALEADPDLLVLPGASYPCGVIPSREAYEGARVRPEAEVLGALGERARRSGTPIAAGLVVAGPDGAPRHAAVLMARSGLVAARATEARPAGWFAAGDGPVPVAAASMPAMLVAGGDLRDPRLASLVVETGAQLVIHAGAPVAWGRDAGRLTASIDEAILAARAAESGAWVITTGKAGIEAGSVVYEGGTGVVDPGGRWLVRAPGDSPGLVEHELDLEAAPGAPVAAKTGPPAVPVRASSAAPLAIPVGAVALDAPSSAVDLIEEMRRLVAAAALHGTRVVVLPDVAGADSRSVTQTETLPLLEALSRASGVVLVVGLAERTNGTTFKTVYAIDNGVVAGWQRQAHLTERERGAGFAAGEEAARPVETSAGAIGLLGGADGLVPGVAGALAAAGAGLLAWCAGEVDAPVEAVARTRAYEQGVPVVASSGTSERGGASIADGRGTLLGRSPVGHALAVHGEV